MVYKKNSNYYISILFNLLEQILNDCLVYLHTIYLQLDNCIKENKNNQLFYFLALLLVKRLINCIILNFN